MQGERDWWAGTSEIGRQGCVYVRCPSLLSGLLCRLPEHLKSAREYAQAGVLSPIQQKPCTAVMVCDTLADSYVRCPSLVSGLLSQMPEHLTHLGCQHNRTLVLPECYDTEAL